MRIASRAALTLFFPMFPFDPPENIQKPISFLFSGGLKGNHEKRRVKSKYRAKMLFFNFTLTPSLHCES